MNAPLHKNQERSEISDRCLEDSARDVPQNSSLSHTPLGIVPTRRYLSRAALTMSPPLSLFGWVLRWLLVRVNSVLLRPGPVCSSVDG